jgi:teichoic acid transport system permease protein
MTDTMTAPDAIIAPPPEPWTPPGPLVTPHDQVREQVERYDLSRAGARQPLREYTRQLWARRRFIVSYSTASNAAGYSRSFIGQAWQLLTPLLNVAVYFLVFGVLLHTKRDVHNFLAFLTVGVFVFAFCSTCVTAGSRSITANLGLTRALQFPRAVLPISTALMALLQLCWSMIILVPIVLATGEHPEWRWFELLPTIALQAMFCVGLALIFSRLGAHVPDTTQTLPFVTRIWMYCSGVLYSVTVFTRGRPEWVHTVLVVNPAHVFLVLARHSLIAQNPASGKDWVVGAVWAVGTLVAGYLFFWNGEEKYGNV